MPSCFQLFKKGTYDAVSLNRLDEDICRQILNCEPHPRRYGGDVFNWFDSIGFIIATNSDCSLGSQELKDKINDWFPLDDQDRQDPRDIEDANNARKVLAYLEEHFASTAFYMHK